MYDFNVNLTDYIIKYTIKIKFQFLFVDNYKLLIKIKYWMSGFIFKCCLKKNTVQKNLAR